MQAFFKNKRMVFGEKRDQMGFPVYSLLTLLALVIIIVFGGVEVHRRQYQHLRQNVLDTLTAIADMKVADIAKWRTDIMTYGRLFGESPVAQAGGAGWLLVGADLSGLRRHLDLLKDNYHYHDVFIAKANEDVLLGSSISPEKIPDNVSNVFREVWQTGEVVMSNLVNSDTYGRSVIFIMAPIGKSGGENPSGVLVMVVNPEDYLYPLVQKWPLPSSSAETLLVRKEGGHVLFLNDLRFAPKAALHLSFSLTQKDLPAVKAVEGERGIVTGRDYRGKKVVAALSAVPGSDWFMVSKVDEAEVFAPMRQWLAGIVLVVVLLAGLAASLFYSHWQRMLKAHARSILEREKVRRRIEEKLRFANEYAVRLIEASNAMIVVLDKEGKITKWNAAAEEVTGYHREEILGKSIFETLIPKNRYPMVYREFGLLLAGAGNERVENPILTKAGVERYIVWRNSVISEYGKFSGVISFGIDITDRKQAEDGFKEAYALLDKANKAKASFLARMSHEIRTPLNAIIGFSEIIEDEIFGEKPAKYREYAKDIHTSGNYLLSLINDILDLSKIEAGKMELVKDVISIEHVIEETTNIIRLVAQGKGIVLEISLQTGLSKIFGDMRALKQVMFNLLSNAIKFTPEGGKVFVEAIPDKNSIHILVRDTGIGISSEDQARIFEPYVQGNIMISQSFGGTGLGLAISRRLVELHGGTLTLESQPGQGTSIHLWLPAISSSSPQH
ncbi:MAG: hypothetical protein A2018_07465 [Alphaproteobacteria bacterium GWF2_58_20]|nr:MAG: hypothetical protein A2018_07465 [Alphaproteobacteria bacterium GWF2_58_20]